MYNGTTCSVFSKSPVNASSYFHNLRNKEREKKQRPWDTDTQRELMQYHWEGKSVLWLLGCPSVSVIKTPLPIQKMQVQSLGHEDTPEKEMATHSSSLAWEISWMEEPGGYSPWGCKRVGCDLVTKQQHCHYGSPQKK